MDTITSKWIIVVFSLIVALSIIGIGSAAYFGVRKTSNTIANGMDKDAMTAEESRYTQYDGLKISGAEVVSLLKRFESDKVCVRVKTSASTISYIYTDFNLGSKSSASIESARDNMSSAYINPTKKFRGTVQYGNKGQITGIIFEQV